MFSIGAANGSDDGLLGSDNIVLLVVMMQKII